MGWTRGKAICYELRSIMAKTPKPAPRPGAPVRGSRTGRPIMALLDLLGRRWALRVLWELRAAPATFRDLQARCGGVSPTVLNDRLRELRDAGILEWNDDAGYRISDQGRALGRTLESMQAWAERWAKREARAEGNG
jgi:DNA-binding HxlR family transcriptional regulator